MNESSEGTVAYAAIIRGFFVIVSNVGNDNPVQQDYHELSPEERIEVALQLLKRLKPLREVAEEEGFEFLSYLLRMVVLEAQSIASGPVVTDKFPCETGDTSYKSDR